MRERKVILGETIVKERLAGKTRVLQHAGTRVRPHTWTCCLGKTWRTATVSCETVVPMMTLEVILQVLEVVVFVMT